MRIVGFRPNSFQNNTLPGPRSVFWWWLGLIGTGATGSLEGNSTGPLGHFKPVRNPRWERGFLGFLKRLGRDEAFIYPIAIAYKYAL
jgi:hypothetical protein